MPSSRESLLTEPRPTARWRTAGRPPGKTGTTNDKAHGVWFIGYTPQLATAVATGDPHCSGGPRCSLNGRVIGGQYYRTVFGATLPAPIWKDAMDRALDGKP